MIGARVHVIGGFAESGFKVLVLGRASIVVAWIVNVDGHHRHVHKWIRGGAKCRGGNIITLLIAQEIVGKKFSKSVE